MTAHTPGPWHRNIKPARKYSIVFAGRNTHVAAIQSNGLSDDETEANCDLVAAAPDLLAACQAVLDEFPAMDGKRIESVKRICRDAIAKAEGRT